MKQLITSMVLFMAIIVTSSSCSKDVLRGEGSTVTETRNLQSFNSVEIAGNREAEIIKSTEWKVEVTGYANLVSAYGSYITNGRLRFEYPNYRNVRHDNIRLRIYTPDITAVFMSGNTDIHIAEGFAGSQFRADLSGNGNLSMGTCNFTSIELRTSGNAEINAEPVQATNADVQVSGSARIQVRATENLKVRISGSGEVHYWGNPHTDVQVSGSGKAIRH
jgi:hypothetical protein